MKSYIQLSFYLCFFNNLLKYTVESLSPIPTLAKKAATDIIEKFSIPMEDFQGTIEAFPVEDTKKQMDSIFIMYEILKISKVNKETHILNQFIDFIFNPHDYLEKNIFINPNLCHQWIQERYLISDAYFYLCDNNPDKLILLKKNRQEAFLSFHILDILNDLFNGANIKTELPMNINELLQNLKIINEKARKKSQEEFYSFYQYISLRLPQTIKDNINFNKPLNFYYTKKYPIPSNAPWINIHVQQIQKDKINTKYLLYINCDDNLFSKSQYVEGDCHIRANNITRSALINQILFNMEPIIALKAFIYYTVAKTNDVKKNFFKPLVNQYLIHNNFSEDAQKLLLSYIFNFPKNKNANLTQEGINNTIEFIKIKKQEEKFTNYQRDVSLINLQDKINNIYESIDHMIQNRSDLNKEEQLSLILKNHQEDIAFISMAFLNSGSYYPLFFLNNNTFILFNQAEMIQYYEKTINKTEILFNPNFTESCGTIGDIEHMNFVLNIANITIPNK
jgi:hypothetical protein